jgi:APA family basic amino acid/polyamine antiporter
MIGSGIFIVSAQVARVLGSAGWLLLAWGVAGAMTVVGALCCSELAAMLPRAGGQYVFFREAYGPLAGFLFGWTMFLVVQSGTIAAVAVAFAKFLGVLVPGLPSRAVAAAVILALTASNATGLKAGTLTQRFLTVAKVLALLALTAFALARPGAHGAFGAGGFWSAASLSGATLGGAALVVALGTAMVGPLFSQTAWTNVTFAGEEVADPGRTLPRALFVGCLLVAGLYVLANVGYLRVLTLPELQHAPEDRVATAVAISLWGDRGARLIAVAIMVSTFGCLNGLILSGARVSFAMARDGLFFRGLERLNKASVPAPALWIQGLWSCLLALSGSYTDLLNYVVSVDLLFYVFLALAVLVLRRRRPELERPFRTPAAPALVAAYAALASGLIGILGWANTKTTGAGYALLLSGLPVFFFWKRRGRPA